MLQDDSYVTQPEKLGSESRNGSGGGGRCRQNLPETREACGVGEEGLGMGTRACTALL